MHTTRLQIVGAGPAGLAAAIHAARHGVRVVVYERRNDVGGRFHDDFQGLENWTGPSDVLEDLEAAGIQPAFEHTGVSRQVGFDPDGREFVYRSSKPFYYLVRRGPAPGTLDRALLDQAVSAGVEVRFGEAVEQLPEGGLIARGPRRSNVLGVGYVFQTKSDDGFYGVLDDRLAPQGYAYLLIHGGRGTVAACMFRDFQRESEYLERVVAFFREKVGFSMENARRFSGVGAFETGRVPAQRTGVLAGEAAGLQDALWGFGMRYAMRSGVLAARRLAGLGDPREIEREERRMLGLYRAGRVNRMVYSHFGSTGYRLFLRAMARSADPRIWLGRQYGASFWKTALASWLAPPSRAKPRTEPA